MSESDNHNPWRVVENAPPGIWCEISEAQMENALNVLPPIYFPGGFAVSEPSRHDGNGDPVYLCVATVGKQYWAVEATIARAAREVGKLWDRRAANRRKPGGKNGTQTTGIH